MAELRIEYTIVEYIDVDVKDYQLTENELNKLANKKFEYHTPSDIDDGGWEWVEEPKVKGSQPNPPDDFWIDTKVGKVAINGHFLIFNAFKVPESVKLGAHWITPPTEEKSRADLINFVEQTVAEDYIHYKSHLGYFNKNYLWLKEMGATVLGCGNESIGYVIIRGVLVALLMPVSVRTHMQNDDFFRFLEQV